MSAPQSIGKQQTKLQFKEYSTNEIIRFSIVELAILTFQHRNKFKIA